MKYRPSFKNNNNLRDKVVGQLQGIIYEIDKQRYNKDLNKDTIKNARDNISNLIRDFGESVGYGTENIEIFYDATINQIEDVKSQLNSTYSGRLDDAVSELDYIIDKWANVLANTITVDVASEELKEKEKSKARKKLEVKLDELMDIYSEYQANEARLEKELMGLERDIKELDDRIISEENDRKIGNLVRKVKLLKTQLAAKNINHENYSFCSELLEMIADLVKEKIIVADFSVRELNEAKAYLKVDSLKKVISEPKRAIATLKKMQEDLKTLVSNLQINQSKLDTFGEIANLEVQAEGEEDQNLTEAMKYKADLIAKRNAKEQAKENLDELDNNKINNDSNNDNNLSKPVK